MSATPSRHRLHPLLFEDVVRAALREDLGRAGDLTTEATIPPDLEAEAHVVAREAGVAAGLDVAAYAFSFYDPRCAVELAVPDGARVGAGDRLATVRGPAASILTAERCALNLLGRMCGIASLTRQVVDSLDGTNAHVVCTRKTTPGLRALEKYSVRIGGGANHRFGLDDAVLIKDNHIGLCGGVRAALDAVRGRVGHLVKIEIEVDTPAQLAEVLAHGGADVVLLDNFGLDQLAAAVSSVAGRMVTEASGGITPERARAVAETGVDLLSLGWLTHSPRSLDVGLDL
ncbi:MAG: carboxylating nicotinate-nucleotide diphosphorylase [Acidimicrobiia bacterium]|nr:carboxylating nicotinate-nucleotide diphosphorylase [Acidimicrobiia bacterium]